MIQKIPEIDFTPYARLLKRIAGAPVSVVILSDKVGLVWKDPDMEVERERSILAVARKIISDQFQENWQEKLGDNHDLIGVSLGELDEPPLGWLLVLVKSSDPDLLIKGCSDPALLDIADLLLNALKSRFEHGEMTTELTSHSNEMAFIYGTDSYLNDPNSKDEGMESIVLECCHHMDIDAATILVPSLDIWSCHLEGVADAEQNWEEELREFSQEVLKQFISAGHNMQVNQLLLEDEIVAGQVHVLVSPIKSRHGTPTGVFILFRRSGERGFSKSEEKVGEVMAARISKYMVAGLDPLTGLLDRLGFEAQVETALERSKEAEGVCTFVKVDIDNFELVNDAYGVIGGDMVLQQLAALTKNHLGNDSVVARIGGDDFGIIMNGLDRKHASVIIEHLREKIANTYFEYDQRSISISVSIGLLDSSEFTGNMTEVELALDVACKNANEKGGNRVQFYEVDNAELIKRLDEISFANKIDAGLEEERFELYCQPLVPLWGANFHYEILLRLKREDGGVYLPDVFLGAAERYNRLPNIDRWVVKTAIKTLSKWAKVLDGQNICWGINLTGQSLAEENFMQFVEEQISTIDFPAEWIYFEITESVAIRNLEQVKEFVAKIKSLGCNFALDDFGTGYSSYEYLKNLPASYLKIDGSFIRNLDNDPFNQLTVQSINQLAHYLGLKTVAEYVETEEVSQIIGKIGVDYAQGYVYGVPQPIEQVLAGLSRQ